MDMTIHDFDMARFLIGDEVEEIYTAAAVRVDPEIGNAGDLDTALIVLRFRNGVIGTIDNSRKAVYGYDQRVEILGSEGKIATENCYPNQAVVSDGKSVHTDLPLNFFMERYTESFAAELKSFVTAVREKRTTVVTGIDGRIPVAMRLRRASRTMSIGRAPPARWVDETIQAGFHPHRRASLGARRCIDSGNIPSDEPEVNS